MATLYTYDTILGEVQDALVRLGLPKPNGVYDSQDENAVLMGSVANEIGPMLLDIYSWQQFRYEFEVVGDSVETAFDLPANFDRFIDNTGWSHANRRPVIIVNAQSWASVRAWVSKSFFINPACRIFNDQLQFMTPPALNESITFEYMSRNWVIDGITPNTLKSKLNANSDQPMHDSVLFTQALRIKWLEQKGMNTTAVQQDFNERFSELTRRNLMAQTLSLNSGGLSGFRYLDGVNMPDTGYGV